MSNPNWTDMEAETSRTSALMSTENERDKAQNNSGSEVEDERISTSMSIHHILNVDQNGQIPGTPSNAEDAEPHKRLCLHCQVAVPADLWHNHIKGAMHQRNVPAAASDRLPPQGIVMPNLSLMASPNRRKQVPPPGQRKRTPPMGIVMPDLTLKPDPSLDLHADQQKAAKDATGAGKKSSPVNATGNPATGYDLSSIDNDVFDAAVILMDLSRSGADGKEWWEEIE